MILNLMAAALVWVAAPDTIVELKDVTVTGNARRDYLMKSSQNSVQVNRDYMEQHFGGSLMQTLEGIPGVKAMSIGSGQSKPTIRGLGFNRMAVTEDGIKHEGQQWGDDHGLEIDQFAIDRAEVIKGPAALLYGSDAIGGVLNLYTNHLPTAPFQGSATLFTRTNNESLGASVKVGGLKDHFFYRANATLINYVDYRVPTDSIQYYSYYIRLKDKRLRNTAGGEYDGSLMMGYAGYNFHADVRISDSYSRSGFFADAHGLEVRLSEIDYDHARRDVDLPYQWVNHMKVVSHTNWHGELWSFEGSLAWQNNQREEHAEPISHGYMPRPDGTMERRFNKNTLTAQLGMRRTIAEQHELKAGLNAEYQRNERSGWGFIIPDFRTASTGLYAIDRWTISENLVANAGLRYDFSHTNVEKYNDWYLTPVAPGDSVYKQRAGDICCSFNSLTWSAGLNYSTGGWVVKANLGKSFRVPIPKELAADGVNYHIFRYEQGNAGLNPEESYQLDAGICWGNGVLDIQVDPYVNYFPNYIYLSPTPQYVEGLQLYQYTQAKVFRWGVEAETTWHITPHWEAELKGEYLYARQESGEKKGYSLPFSTPWSADAGGKYKFHWHGDGFVGLNVHLVGDQHEIVPPEKPTDGYWTLTLAAGKQFPLTDTTKLRVSVHADNLLNRRYYDHTSYYRLIDVPEPGFNMALMVGVDF